MLTVIAVDDQDVLLDSLGKYLKTIDFIKLVALTTNALDALNYIIHSKPHVALLDIDMPLINGISLAEKITELSPQTAIVFITSHSHYVQEAFKVYAYDFIQKPFDPERLAKTLKRLYQLKAEEATMLDIRTDTGSRFINPKDVLIIEALGKMCLLRTKQGEFTIRYSLNEAEDLFNQPFFFKSSRSFIINIHEVTGLEKLTRTSYRISFSQQHVYAQLSKSLYDDFKEKLDHQSR